MVIRLIDRMYVIFLYKALSIELVNAAWVGLMVVLVLLLVLFLGAQDDLCVLYQRFREKKTISNRC